MPETLKLPLDMQSELASLRNVIGLAAFAVEARRVLSEIDIVADMNSCVNEGLKAIQARSQWSTTPDMVAPVLIDVCERLDALMVWG